MRRFAPPVPTRSSCVRLFSAIAIAAGLALTTIQAQVPGRNVNMVSGTSWPNGDPFLQRQNEPSIAASTRNPLHLLAGSNDYRTVDIPGICTPDPVTGECKEPETGDAWLGLFKSVDGGQRWTSTLHPGYPQDQSPAGLASPLKAYGAGADAVVRAGTHGLIYYSGLVFNREENGTSAVFLSRFVDNNNQEAADPFAFLGTSLVAASDGQTFLDKPWMAVDIPRDNAAICTITPSSVVETTNGRRRRPNRPRPPAADTQNIPAGAIYVAYSSMTHDGSRLRSEILLKRSNDCGVTWSRPIRVSRSQDQVNQGATITIDPRDGTVYVGYRRFDPDLLDNVDLDAIMMARLPFRGDHFDPAGQVHQFKPTRRGPRNLLGIFEHLPGNDADDAPAPGEVATQVVQFDLGTTGFNFRTNAYPTMAADGSGRIYTAWTQRGFSADSGGADGARIVISTTRDGRTFTPAQPVDDHADPGRGHQFMPSMTYAGGKLMLIYYDLRETRAQLPGGSTAVHDRIISDANKTIRHTVDIRSVMADPGEYPDFADSVKVSDYLMGVNPRTGQITELQVNPPNLPMFKLGTAPFMGDYIDVAAAPAFIPVGNGKWAYNTESSGVPPVFHATWTDNRDVRPPTTRDQYGRLDWTKYTPAKLSPDAPAGQSIFDPTQTVPQCTADSGNAGSRNQNIYSARITGTGLIAGSPGNAKPLSPELQRGFVVFAQNTTDATRSYRMTIVSQPPGGRASFEQFPLPPYTSASPAPETAIEMIVPPRSTAARTVYVTSSDPAAQINVTVTELEDLRELTPAEYPSAEPMPDGATARVMLNPDIENPDIENPDIENPDIENPDIENPDIENVYVANPDIENPDIENPDIENPDIENPDIENPDIENPDIENGAIADVTWRITNTGNTTASFNVNLFLAQQNLPQGVVTQLVLLKTYRTPVTVPNGCQLAFQTRNILLANIPNPVLVPPDGETSDPNDPAEANATLWLAPGEEGRIVMRVFDDNTADNVLVPKLNEDGTPILDEDGNPKYVSIDSSVIPSEDITPVVQQQSVNTEDAEAGVIEPPIVPAFPSPQTVPDSVSTAAMTPVTINVLANDSTAFGSTKVISLHPAGMATHSGTVPGDIAFQPASGFLYTQRGAIDPASDALVGRFPSPTVNAAGLAYQIANPRSGINYARTGASPSVLVALDARPDSATFHQYLPMPSFADTVYSIGLDTSRNRLYVLHGPASGVITTSSLTAIDAQPGSPTFHQVLFTVSIAGRGQAVAVNTRTQRVYATSSNGVFMLDANAGAPAAVKLTGTTGSLGIAINEASNLVFASTQIGPTPGVFGLYAIDGATGANTLLNTGLPFQAGSIEERLAVHEASGRVYMKLSSMVAVIDGQRGSPSRNTVVATIPVSRDSGAADIAIDQELGLVVTVGNMDFKTDIISVAGDAWLAAVPNERGASEVTIDPVNHRAFVSVALTHVQEITLSPLGLQASVPVFVESGGVLINPLTNKAYAGITARDSVLGKISGAGFEGVIAGTTTSGRFLFGARHEATDRYFIVNQTSADQTTATSGSVTVIDGPTDTVVGGPLDTPSSPFGIGINQASGKVYVGTLGNSLTGHGQILIGNANDLNEDAVAADISAIPPIGANALLGFGRHIVVNPVTGRVYVLILGASNASIAVVDPVTNVATPLDGAAGTPLGTSYGRAEVMRVDAVRNRVYIAFFNPATNVNTIVSIDGATHNVLGTFQGGRHSNRHTPSYLVVNPSTDRVFVSNYAAQTVTMLDGTSMNVIATAVVPNGPSAMVVNESANRVYVSSIDTKTLTALDAGQSETLPILSSVRLPFVAYFLNVDEEESRIYTSGGDSMDESGVMVVTDVLGQLGTNVSVTGALSTGNGTVTVNPDYSVTYTPNPGFTGVDTFTYSIAAPTGTANGTATVTVVPAASAPVAFGDAYSVVQGQPLTIAAPGPLGNDAVPAFSTMSVTQEPANGSLDEQPDGSFVYTANPGFTGTDSFKYFAATESGATNIVTVSVTVTSPTALVVLNTNDSGAGSLRQALSTANLEPGSQISFNISGAGPHLIQPATALPAVLTPVTIDGYTQPGSQPNSAAAGTNAIIKIEIRGNASTSNGLDLQGGASTVRGIAINGFNNAGIRFTNGGGNVVEGSFIGTTAAGAATPGNNNGVLALSPNNQIGGPSLASRNLISGNNIGIALRPNVVDNVVVGMGSNAVIVNNLVGINAAGAAAHGQTSHGIEVTVPDVRIGGSSPIERNIISGNGGNGVNAFPWRSGSTIRSMPTGLVVRGNFIGTNATGVAAVANNVGLQLAAPGVIVGGVTDAGLCTLACNLISGNNGNGVSLGANFDNTTGTRYADSAGAFVQGNFIGVNITGSVAVPNTQTGVATSSPNGTIGGSDASLRNVIAGNGGGGLNIFTSSTVLIGGSTPVVISSAQGTTVRGNYVGVNASGSSLLANATTAIFVSSANVTIGGADVNDGNVVGAGGVSMAISLARQFNASLVVDAGGNSVVRNNIVGLNAAKNARLNSGGIGISLQSANNQVIGNIIAGMGSNIAPLIFGNGISIFGTAATGNVVAGNFVGTNDNSDGGLGNTGFGIHIQNASNNTIGGVLPADRNIIGGNSSSGVNLGAQAGDNTSNNAVIGNYIGVHADGVNTLGNGNNGVQLFSAVGGTVTGNVIGGSTAAAANVISGNTFAGVSLGGAGTTNNHIRGNRIGTVASGLGAKPNTNSGVFINDATDNFIGGPTGAEGNVIAFNNHNGVTMNAAAARNRILSNSIRSNTILGIDLNANGATPNDMGDGDAGANNLQNFPALSNATNSAGATTRVDIDLSSFAAGSYTLQFFANTGCDGSGNGEGDRLITTFTGFAGPSSGQFFLNEAVPTGQFITATATDAAGNTSEFSSCAEVDPPPTIVTNTNDSGPGSLRQAILSANAMPGTQTISFAIPTASAASPALIQVASPLPVLTDSVVIDGTTQSGYDGLPVVAVRSPSNTTGWNGFEINTSNVTIRGLSIWYFGQGIFGWQAQSGHVIEDNVIGTNRTFTGGLGNGTGVLWRANNSRIANNIIAGNGTGISIVNGGSGNAIEANKIGVVANGTTVLANSGSGVTMYDGANSNTFTGNVISGNSAWGVDIQHSGVLAPVNGTIFRGNVIGLDTAGNDAGNFSGGIRVQNAPNTYIGEPGQPRNVISGNGGPLPANIGPGIHIVDTVTPAPLIRNNYIGLDPTGVFARSNNNKGVVLDGPARVGGWTVAERNYISGNGDMAGGAGVIANLGATGALIYGNVIGLNVNGDAVGNGYSGVTVRTPGSVNIGSALVGSGNIISGNGAYGVSVMRLVGGDPMPANVWIARNMIGTDEGGTLPRSNGSAGINIEGDSHIIGGVNGVGNVIAFNGSEGGIRVIGGAATQVQIRENSIFDNAGLGIDLDGDGPTANDAGDADSGANGRQNYPEIVGVSNAGVTTQVTIETNVLAPGSYGLEFYSVPSCDPSGFGEGRRLQLNNVGTTGGVGFQQFTLNELVPPGHFVTAVAFGTSMATSEFSPCAMVPAEPIVVGPAGGSGGAAFGPIDCPVGSVVVGLTGRAGDDIDETRIVCAPKPALAPTNEILVATNGGGGTDYGGALMCGANEAITGLFGGTVASGWIDYLGVTCTNLSTGGSINRGPVGTAEDDLPFAPLSCPAGKQVVGLQGRQGALLDQISIRCR